MIITEVVIAQNEVLVANLKPLIWALKSQWCGHYSVKLA